MLRTHGTKCIFVTILSLTSCGILSNMCKAAILNEAKPECQKDQNKFDPYWFGECPTGTSWDDETGCCHGCPVCGPGWKQSPGCRGLCDPCPVNTCSEGLDNKQCSFCMKCEDLHRVEEHPCYPARQTECGDCIEGYYVQEGAPSDIACIRCNEYSRDEPRCQNNVTIAPTEQDDVLYQQFDSFELEVGNVVGGQSIDKSVAEEVAAIKYDISGSNGRTIPQAAWFIAAISGYVLVSYN